MALRVTLFRAHEHSVAGKKNTFFCSIPMSNCSRGLVNEKYIGRCSEQNTSTKWNQACIREQLMIIYNNSIISWVKLIATITWRDTILIWKQRKWIKQFYDLSYQLHI